MKENKHSIRKFSDTFSASFFLNFCIYTLFSLCFVGAKVFHGKDCLHQDCGFFINRFLMCIGKSFFLSFQCHHMSLVNFVVPPPGCGRSVTDFCVWDTHETQLGCPDEVDGDI
jgi:hypothetical protein